MNAVLRLMRVLAKNFMWVRIACDPCWGGAATNPLIFVKQDEAPQRKRKLCFLHCALCGKASVRYRTEVPTGPFVMPICRAANANQGIGISPWLTSEQTAEEATDTLSRWIGVSIAARALPHSMLNKRDRERSLANTATRGAPQRHRQAEQRVLLRQP